MSLIGLRRSLRNICALAALLFFLSGCTYEKAGPFLTAQLCVSNEAGMAQLIDELRKVAASRGMEFNDYSARTERELEIVGYPGKERADGSPLLNVVVGRSDGLSVGATNISLPGYQVALGFTEGSSRLETQHFVDDVIQRLEKYWEIERLPAGSGALPKAGCR